MRALARIGEKVAHFVAVLFLGSFFLAGFLWLSPGSPGRPTVPVDWERVLPEQTEVCLGADRCGVASGHPDPTTMRVQVQIDGEFIEVYSGEVKAPGPTFGAWFLGVFWGGLLRGDVGESTAFDEPALEVVAAGARYTLPIVFVTLGVSIVVALGLVALLVWLPFPALRGAIRALLLLISISPVFILAYILQGNGVLNAGAVTTAIFVACVGVLALGDSNLGEMVLEVENEVQRLRSQDYVHAARLRGAHVGVHMLPGLLLPIASVSAAKVAFLLGSVVIVERLWGVPGLGDASLIAAERGDALLLVTLTVLVAGVVAFVALLQEVLEILIDPRLRRASKDVP
jgi:ABC-type dipeptide/oligopeptide/nickel transport system permease component